MWMQIKPSAMIRRNYNKISEICRRSGKPVFLTKNGKGDMVAIAVEQFFEKEEQIALREKLVDIEKRRRKGVKDLSSQEVCGRLQEMIGNYKLLELTEENEYPSREEKSSGDCHCILAGKGAGKSSGL